MDSHFQQQKQNIHTNFCLNSTRLYSVLIALILFELQIPMHAKPRMANVLSSACRQDKISVSVSALQDMSVKMRPTVQVSTPYTHDQRNVIFWFDVLFSWIGTLFCAL